MDTKRVRDGSLGPGMALILFGLLFLATTQGYVGLTWGNMWPAFVLIPGLAALARAFYEPAEKRGGPIMGGLTAIGLGGFFFATTYNWVSWSDQATLWPLYILIPGVAALVAYAGTSLRQPGYLIPGTVLSVIGVGLLAATQAGVLYDSRFWEAFNGIWQGSASFFGGLDLWWPVALLVVGGGLLALALAQRSRNGRAGLTVAGSIPFLLGVFFLSTTLGLVSWEAQGWLWPLYPLIVGVSLLAGWAVSGRTTTGFLVPGAILATIGSVFLVLSLPSIGRVGEWWPVFLILGGVLLLVLPRLGHQAQHPEQKGIRR